MDAKRIQYLATFLGSVSHLAREDHDHCQVNADLMQEASEVMIELGKDAAAKAAEARAQDERNQRKILSRLRGHEMWRLCYAPVGTVELLGQDANYMDVVDVHWECREPWVDLGAGPMAMIDQGLNVCLQAYDRQEEAIKDRVLELGLVDLWIARGEGEVIFQEAFMRVTPDLASWFLGRNCCEVNFTIVERYLHRNHS